MATKIVDYDLADGARDLNNLAPYSHVLVLFRWRGKPLGRVCIGVENGGLSQHTLWWTASTNFGYAALPNIMEEIVSDDDNRIDEISKLPTCSVVISTHNRLDDLRRCLDSIFAFTASDIEIIVVDNAPSDDSTARLSANYPVSYIIERRKGASWARTRGAKEASGEVVVYVDDDVVVDNNWVDNLLQPFVRPEVAAVTSLVMPLELETGAQELFELHNGFTFRGFSEMDFTANNISPVSAGLAGASACMAVRRSLVNTLNLFAVEMGPGTVTRSGEDTYAIYRLLSKGYRIVYNPAAVVWHRHRGSYRELRDWLYGYSVGAFTFYLRCLFKHGETVAIHNGLSWFFSHHIRQLWWGLRRRPGSQPLFLTLAEIRGVLAAPKAYMVSRLRERSQGIKHFAVEQASVEGS